MTGTAKTEEEIDQIAQDYLGINRYIKMDALPYDGINHIDMHMKLLDEERILVAEPPTDHELYPIYEEIIENELKICPAR